MSVKLITICLAFQVSVHCSDVDDGDWQQDLAIQQQELAIKREIWSGVQGVGRYRQLFPEYAQALEQDYQEELRQPIFDINEYDDPIRLHNGNVLYLINRGYMGVDGHGGLYRRYPYKKLPGVEVNRTAYMRRLQCYADQSISLNSTKE